MKINRFILNFIFLLLSAAFIMTPSCTSQTDCDCTKRPDKFHIADFQTNGVVFEWGKEKVDLHYELTIQQLDDAKKTTKTYTFSELAADPSSKVIIWDEFLKQKHTYRAWIKTNCTEVALCSDKAFSPNSDTVVFSTFLSLDSTACPPPVLNADTIINNTGYFSWNPILGAQGYFVHIVNANGSSSTIFTTTTNGTVLLPTNGVISITVQTLCDSINGTTSNNSNAICWVLGGGTGGMITVVEDDLDICSTFGCDSTNFNLKSDDFGCAAIEQSISWCLGTTDLLLQLRDLSGACTEMPKRTEVIDLEYVVEKRRTMGTLIYVTTTSCSRTDYSATILPYSSRECSEVKVTGGVPSLCK